MRGLSDTCYEELDDELTKTSSMKTKAIILVWLISYAGVKRHLDQFVALQKLRGCTICLFHEHENGHVQQNWMNVQYWNDYEFGFVFFRFSAKSLSC